MLWRLGPKRLATINKVCKRAKNYVRKHTTSTTNNDAIDTAKTVLKVIHQSADALPPLKSAVGGVLAIWEIAERMKTISTEARALALRCSGIIDIITHSVGRSATLSRVSYPQMLVLKMFDPYEACSLLTEIQRALADIKSQSRLKRLSLLRHNRDQLRDFECRLDEAYEGISLVASLQTYRTVENSAAKFEAIDTTLRHIDIVILDVKRQQTYISIAAVIFF